MNQSPILNRHIKQAKKNLPTNARLFLATEIYMTAEEKEKYLAIVRGGENNASK